MKLADSHLTYCTNIHAGESWGEIRENVGRHVTAVRDRVSPGQPFGIGLRLSGRAARELAEPAALEEFRDLLAREDMYVFTINAFPYGPFHGQRVKEGVYLPDWADDERLTYTDTVAHLFAQLLPDDDALVGSISTVPGAFKERAGGPEVIAGFVQRLVRHVATLHDIRRRTGRSIVLALEPEPCCFLETSQETCEFFERHLLAASARHQLAELCQLPVEAAEGVLRRHLGVCLDTCHAAVEFEEADAVLQRLRRAGIQIAKLQLSTGLCLPQVDASSLAAVSAYDESVYLHQVVELGHDGELLRFVDLPDALAGVEERRPQEWRVHFHVPLYREDLGTFVNTQPFLRQILAAHAKEPVSPHLEVETYTWDVLPREQRDLGVVASICRELDWVTSRCPA